MRRVFSYALLALVSIIPICAGQSYVVTAFDNRARERALDWIGESVAESMRSTMRLSGLSVASREEREEAIKKLSLRPGSELSFASRAKLAEALNTDFLIHGDFEFIPNTGPKASALLAAPAPQAEDNAPPASAFPSAPPVLRGQIRLTARLFDRRHVQQTAEIVERGAIEDLASLQGLLAWRLLKFIRPQSAPTREEFERRHPPVKLTALENYIRGLLASNEESRHRYFAHAARLEPGFAQPCFYLGRIQWEKDNYRVAAGWLEKIGPGQDHFLEATFYLGLSRYQMSNFEGARDSFERLSRELALPEVVNNLGAVQLALELPAALENFRKALEKNPADPDYHFNVGYALWRAGRFEEAAQSFRASLDRAPDDQDAILLLGRCLKKSGPRAGDLRAEGLERLKEEIDDSDLRLARTISLK